MYSFQKSIYPSARFRKRFYCDEPPEGISSFKGIMSTLTHKIKTKNRVEKKKSGLIFK